MAKAKTVATKTEKPGNLISVLFGRVQQSALLMCGVPNYDTYLAHMKLNHPDKEAMTYEAFFENRMNARFNHSGAKACC
jgi:uncharacterized short protein YbdD (DUF466 family)